MAIISLMDEPLSAEWLAHLRGRNLAANTLATYARTLRTFPDIATANRDEVEAWWESRADLAPSTRRNELAAVRGFYGWMLRFDHREDDPSRRIDAPQMPRRLPRPLSRADLITLIDALGGELRRAIVLGAYAGLRVSETAALDWSDIDLEFRRIRVHGKGAKDRLVGLNPLLMDYLLPDTGGNVVRAGGQPYSAATLQRKVNRAIRAVGVDATYHNTRHRFGTVALAGTSNLLAVSRAMGHSKPETTAIYAAASDSDLDLIAAAVMR